ncbi:hypothetical protein, partial [Mesonia sp. K7]|uniref:hypothetical protein n=1 Tax=Mesonia sp. K7 TaxID=2218606 RepID=UPI000DB53C7A
LLLLGVMTIITSLSIYAQTYPGGVTGAEVWYKADSLDITNNQYLNFAETEITLNDCGDHQPSLYNFNPSIHAEDQLCLIYRVPIENVSERDIFFVGLTDPNPEISYLTTQWHRFEQQQPLIVSFDSIVRNHFDISNQKTYINKLVGNYSSVKNAHVNYYHWNQFDIDRKFKSYGELGETYIYIGKDYTDKESQDPVEYFKGKFPEYLSFPYPLSANEKNRVESYLALKYGITLSSSTSYKNSSNTVFWEKENNGIFYNNIFGMGRDDLSGLHQVQSNSMHYEGKLISSIDQKYKYSNEELLKVTSLPNDHFIVFGDNEQPDDGLRGEPNSKGVEILNRIWLSQSTGDYMQEFPVFFCLESAFLYDIIDSHNNEKGNEENQWVLWMLHDKYTSHDEESDFNSEFVNYYKPYEREDITACYGMVITEGEEPVEEPIIFFDGDLNKYDQFTFGVGPEIIVQFQHTGCNPEEGYET